MGQPKGCPIQNADKKFQEQPKKGYCFEVTTKSANQILRIGRDLMDNPKRILCDLPLNKEFTLKELICDTDYAPNENVINLYTGDNDFSIGCNWKVKKEVCDGKWVIWTVKPNFVIKSLKSQAMGTRQIAWMPIFYKKVSDKWKNDLLKSTEEFKKSIDEKMKECGISIDDLSGVYCHIAKIPT